LIQVSVFQVEEIAVKPPRRLFKNRRRPESKPDPIEFAAFVACIFAYKDGARGETAIRFAALAAIRGAIDGEDGKKRTLEVDGEEAEYVDITCLVQLAIKSPANKLGVPRTPVERERLWNEFDRAIDRVFVHPDWHRILADLDNKEGPRFHFKWRPIGTKKE
jgi:hypothetical protein